MAVRSGRRGGFSLVELLVTVIIAGIAFAALVPVMVQAINTGAGDRMRVLAVNAAQDRIEKLRQLDFDQITEGNLSSSSFYFGQFGQHWVEHTASGDRTLNVAYRVVEQPVSATDTRIADKVVRITVDWTGRPTPVKPVVLSTIIYRQYAGPQIVDFSVAPYDANQDLITSSTVQLTATINSADVTSMQTVGSASGHVDFAVTPAGGGTSTKASVYYSATSPASYTTTWLVLGASGVIDGYYDFKAIAYTANNYPGNTWQFSKRIESGPPAAVTGLTAQGLTGSSFNGVVLQWHGSASLDVGHYEVYRTSNGVTTRLDDGSLGVTATGFTDTTAVSGLSYTYTVRAVDQLGNPTPAYLALHPGTSETSCSVEWIPPVVPPDPAENFKGSQGSQYVAAATLSWDPPSHWTGSPILGYQVYAAGDGANPVATVTNTSASIPQNWNTSTWYQVKPFIEGGLVSAGWATIAATVPAQATRNVGGTLWVQVTIGAQPTYTLHVINDVQSGKTATITLYYLGATGSDPATQVGSAQTNITYNGQATWTNLAAGRYRWAWKTSNNKSGQREGMVTGTPYEQTVYCVK